ncbi:hypothetical protein Tco_0223967 [Tanacetum coccineum]
MCFKHPESKIDRISRETANELEVDWGEVLEHVGTPYEYYVPKNLAVLDAFPRGHTNVWVKHFLFEDLVMFLDLLTVGVVASVFLLDVATDWLHFMLGFSQVLTGINHIVV